MFPKHLLATAAATLAMTVTSVASAAALLTIVNTDPGRQEHTGDPGGSVYPSNNGTPPGPGVPWQVPNPAGAAGAGWPTGPGMSVDSSFPPGCPGSGPCNVGTSGWYGAYLQLNQAANVTFQYMGKGNSSLANTFQIDDPSDGLGNWITLFPGNGGPCGAAGAAPVTPTCTAGSNEFTYALPAGYLPFRFVTGNSVTLTNDGTGNPTNILQSPSYFLGVDPYLATIPHQLSGQAVYAGLSDLPGSGDHDFQDLGVRISTVPEPGTMALLGLVMGGVALRSRRKQTA